MHFTNAGGNKVELAPGCTARWDPIGGGLIRYFLENGLKIEFQKGRNSDSKLDQADDFGTFRTRALIAARIFDLNIEQVGETNAFKFVAS
jgi:hypothetical protein